LIRNLPVSNLKLDFGVGVLLGKCDGVVGTKREVSAEENVGDMAVQRESNELVFCFCMHLEAIIPVHQMPTDYPWLEFFYDFGGN